MRIAITGAAGFVGRQTVEAALARGHQPVAVVRRAPEQAFAEGAETRVVGDLLDPQAQDAAVAGCDGVIHLAARVRVERSERSREAELMRRDNALLTRDLAEAAARAGCRRFVLASSMKVYGSTTPNGVTLTEASATAPNTEYGASKLEAEQLLAQAGARTGLSTICLRPPAVFGPGASASQLRLLAKLVTRGLPLPLGGVNNRRSFIYSGNLASALVAACESEATGAYVVTDSEPISTARLAQAIAAAIGRKARLVPTPVPLVRLAVRALGRGEMADSLYASMVADGTAFRAASGWAPGTDFEQAMALTVGGDQ